MYGTEGNICRFGRMHPSNDPAVLLIHVTSEDATMAASLAMNPTTSFGWKAVRCCSSAPRLQAEATRRNQSKHQKEVLISTCLASAWSALAC